MVAMVDLMRFITGKQPEIQGDLGVEAAARERPRLPANDASPVAPPDVGVPAASPSQEAASDQGTPGAECSAADALWSAECLESLSRFGHADALLYPLLRGPVQTPQGVGVLQQVLGGFAVVEFEGMAAVKRFAANAIRPVGPASKGVDR